MVRIIAITASCLLAYTLSVSAAPANTTVVDTSVDDILNAPAIPDPIQDPAFKPVNGGSNATLVADVPAIAATINALPSIKASIASVAGTAVATGSVSAVATPTSKVPISRPTHVRNTPRALEARHVPPAPHNFLNITCNDQGKPSRTYPQWKAAIYKACIQLFDPLFPPTAPLRFLYEGSVGGVTVGPTTKQFHFTYHVRQNSITPYDSYQLITSTQCIAELEARMYAAMVPDPGTGQLTAFGACDDSSGMSSEPDVNAAIWWEITTV